MPKQQTPLLTLRNGHGLLAVHDAGFAASVAARHASGSQGGTLFDRISGDAAKFLSALVEALLFGLRGKARRSLGTAIRAKSVRDFFIEHDAELLDDLRYTAEAADAVRHLTTAVLDAAHVRLLGHLGGTGKDKDKKHGEGKDKGKGKGFDSDMVIGVAPAVPPRPRRRRKGKNSSVVAAATSELGDEWADTVMNCPNARQPAAALSQPILAAPTATGTTRALTRGPSDESAQPAAKLRAVGGGEQDLSDRTAAAQFVLNQRVVLHGLASRPELTGSTATVVGTFDAVAKRWPIKLDSGESIAVKPANLKLSIFGGFVGT